jgi:hypothetical protein
MEMKMARICSKPDCGLPHTARGFCHRHYREFLRSGAERVANPTRYYGLTNEQRFWIYVQKGPRCWEWTGFKNEKGYGIINLRGERMMAHRMSYELEVGPIPNELYVLHHCDNPSCVKPKHLFIGTKADNNADMDAKGRARRSAPSGERNASAKLTGDDVRAIRASKESLGILSERYGIAKANIWAARTRKTWKHIE